MGMSDRRRQMRAKKRAAKEARMKREKVGESVYALKRRGIYPKNSPYVTGDYFGRRMKKLDGYPYLCGNVWIRSEVPHA